MPAAFGLRQPRDGEVFIGLDERELVLDREAQVVTCHDLPVAIAGVMGSKASGVTAPTKGRIWLESAMFSPCGSVRTTARSVGLRTDASARFEKGLPLDLTLACSVRAARTAEELFSCGTGSLGRWRRADGSAHSTAPSSALQKLLGPLNAERTVPKISMTR